jgi:hypothetical protein
MGDEVVARLREDFGSDIPFPELLDGLGVEAICRYRARYLALTEGFLGEPEKLLVHLSPRPKGSTCFSAAAGADVAPPGPNSR